MGMSEPPIDIISPPFDDVDPATALAFSSLLVSLDMLPALVDVPPCRGRIHRRYRNDPSMGSTAIPALPLCVSSSSQARAVTRTKPTNSGPEGESSWYFPCFPYVPRTIYDPRANGHQSSRTTALKFQFGRFASTKGPPVLLLTSL